MTEEEALSTVKQELEYADSQEAQVNMVTGWIGRIRKLANIINELIAENKSLKQQVVKEEEELFWYIMPGVVDDNERLKIHKEIKNLVRRYPLPTIWENLNRLGKEGKVYFKGVKCELVYNELVRMGMPSTSHGFSLGSFKNLYDNEAGKNHTIDHSMAS